MAWTLTLCATMASDAQQAVLPLNLEEMVFLSDRIFIGRCAAIEPGTESITQGQLLVTRYTFDIEQALKGDLPVRITWTQLGLPPRSALKRGPVTHGRVVQAGLTLHGPVPFVVGDRMLVFLTPEYGEGRLAYPVGLEQGAFALEEDDDGQPLARSLAGGNDPVPLAPLLASIRQIHAAHGGTPGTVRHPNGGQP